MNIRTRKRLWQIVWWFSPLEWCIYFGNYTKTSPIMYIARIGPFELRRFYTPQESMRLINDIDKIESAKK